MQQYELLLDGNKYDNRCNRMKQMNRTLVQGMLILKPVPRPTPTLLTELKSPAGNISPRWIEMYRTLHITSTTATVTSAHLFRVSNNVSEVTVNMTNSKLQNLLTV